MIYVSRGRLKLLCNTSCLHIIGYIFLNLSAVAKQFEFIGIQEVHALF